MMSKINEAKQQQIEETKRMQQIQNANNQKQTNSTPLPNITTQKVSSQVSLS